MLIWFSLICYVSILFIRLYLLFWLLATGWQQRGKGKLCCWCQSAPAFSAWSVLRAWGNKNSLLMTELLNTFLTQLLMIPRKQAKMKGNLQVYKNDTPVACFFPICSPASIHLLALHYHMTARNITSFLQDKWSQPLHAELLLMLHHIAA